MLHAILGGGSCEGSAHFLKGKEPRKGLETRQEASSSATLRALKDTVNSMHVSGPRPETVDLHSSRFLPLNVGLSGMALRPISYLLAVSAHTDGLEVLSLCSMFSFSVHPPPGSILGICVSAASAVSDGSIVRDPGILELIEDDSKAGECMRITNRTGRDYWRPKNTGPPARGQGKPGAASLPAETRKM